MKSVKKKKYGEKAKKKKVCRGENLWRTPVHQNWQSNKRCGQRKTRTSPNTGGDATQSGGGIRKVEEEWEKKKIGFGGVKRKKEKANPGERETPTRGVGFRRKQGFKLSAHFVHRWERETGRTDRWVKDIGSSAHGETSDGGRKINLVAMNGGGGGGGGWGGEDN